MLSLCHLSSNSLPPRKGWPITCGVQLKIFVVCLCCKYSYFLYLCIYSFSVYVNTDCKSMSKRQPNYTEDEIEVIVSGVEKNSKVSPQNYCTSLWDFVPTPDFHSENLKISPLQVDCVVNKTRRRRLSLLMTTIDESWLSTTSPSAVRRKGGMIWQGKYRPFQVLLGLDRKFWKSGHVWKARQRRYGST